MDNAEGRCGNYTGTKDHCRTKGVDCDCARLILLISPSALERL